MRIISLVLVALTLTKLLSLLYFASKSKTPNTLSQFEDAGKVFLDEGINDEILREQPSAETDEILNEINSDNLDELLDQPVQYDDDTVDDDFQDDDQDPQALVNNDLILKTDEKIDEKVDDQAKERELEQEKKTPEAEPVAEKPAPAQNVKRLVEGIDFVRENGVIVGTDANFQDLVRYFKYTFIDFYAEWCGWCKKLEPEFEKTAQIMKKLNPDVGFIKINLTRNKAIKKAYKIHRFPTVVLFNRLEKKTTTFRYDRTPLVMAKWIQKTLKQQGSIPK